MRRLNHLQQSLLYLRFAKLRSVLALLGVLVGTASVVAMILGGELATQAALKQFQSLGTDLLAVAIHPNSAENLARTQTSPAVNNYQQILTLSHTNSAILQIAPYSQLFLPVFYQDQSLSNIILGVTDSFAAIMQLQLQQGRFVSMLDDHAFYAVIGYDIYTSLKKLSAIEPLGKQIQIGNNIITIVGILKPWPENGFISVDINNAILVPLPAALLISSHANINNVLLRLTPSANIIALERTIKNHLSAILPDKQFTVRSAKELIAKMRQQNDIFTVFLGLIGSITLLVGGVGIMNIMLVSITQRRREIGIRLAVGAKQADICILFLLEAVILSLSGGILGIIFGVLIAYLVAYYWHWDFMLFWQPIILGFFVSVMVGIFFGFYPAYRAAKLDPIIALHH